MLEMKYLEETLVLKPHVYVPLGAIVDECVLSIEYEFVPFEEAIRFRVRLEGDFVFKLSELVQVEFFTELTETELKKLVDRYGLVEQLFSNV
jgi:hypothetical protein